MTAHCFVFAPLLICSEGGECLRAEPTETWQLLHRGNPPPAGSHGLVEDCQVLSGEVPASPAGLGSFSFRCQPASSPAATAVAPEFSLWARDTV